MALVVSAAEMLDAIDARKARRCCSVFALIVCFLCSAWVATGILCFQGLAAAASPFSIQL